MKLRFAVEQYITRKRLMGFKYENNAKELRAFVRLYPEISLTEIRVQHVRRFLNRATSGQATWISRYVRFRAFFYYWRGRQEIANIPLPAPRRMGKRPFSAYIYTGAQIRALLKNTRVLDRELTAITPTTFRALMVMLVATGMGLGEALALRKRDLDLEAATLDLHTCSGAGRRIPIGRGMLRNLKRHLKITHASSDLVFSTKTGSPILVHRAAVCFRRCRRKSGIRREDGAPRQPGLRDLRHTFAVNRITQWQRNGANLELMLPRLSVYMGLQTFHVTERYLPFAPTYFRKQVQSLCTLSRGSGYQSRKLGDPDPLN